MGKLKKKYTLIWGYPEELFYKRVKNGKGFLITEMRPGLFGASFLAKKLKGATLISDNMLGVLFQNRAIREVILFYQDRDSFGLSMPAGTFTVVILAKRHNVPIKVLKGEKSPFLRLKDRNATTFLGKKVTPESVLPVIPELNFLDYKLLES